MDLKTGMYIGYGYSNKSEKEAFKKAVKFVKGHDIPLNKVRLDKYYSNKKDIQELGEDVEAFVLPKKNLSNFGYEWHEILNRIKEDPYGFLKNYFKRELSETFFGADKERFGKKSRSGEKTEEKPHHSQPQSSTTSSPSDYHHPNRIMSQFLSYPQSIN